MTTEATTRAEALAEIAAIRAAAPAYVGKAAPTEAEARAEAAAEAEATAILDSHGQPVGAIVLAETAEAEARAARAASARAELPAIEWIPAPKQQPRKLTEAELTEARAAKRAEASIAREVWRAELADSKAAEARAARRAAVVGSADSMFTELQSSPAELAEAARKAGATGKLAAAEARAAYLAETGMTEAEAREIDLLTELAEAEEIVTVDIRPATLADLLAAKPNTDAGQQSALSPAELAAVAEWTAAMQSSPAARAGRLALEAMGPRASAMVVTNRKARKIAIAKVCRVPKVETAEARASKAAEAAEAAQQRLAEAEAAELAAIGQKARQPIRKAEAEADRLAAVAGKAEARAVKAAAVLAEARQLAARPAIDGLVFLPVASFKLAEAWNAWELALPVRQDRMPARYADRGPAAKSGVKLTDNTAREAIAELSRLTEAEIDAYWQQTWNMVNEWLTAKRAAEAEAAAAAEADSKAARKAYKAAHERDRRARARK